MTAKINAIAARFGVQLIADEMAYTTHRLYSGEMPPYVLAHTISKMVYKELGEVIIVGVLVWCKGATPTIYATYNPAKEHPNGVKGEQRPY